MLSTILSKKQKLEGLRRSLEHKLGIEMYRKTILCRYDLSIILISRIVNTINDRIMIIELQNQMYSSNEEKSTSVHSHRQNMTRETVDS